MTRKATIAEVAKLAGVHESTVSRALNPATASIVNIRTVRRVKSAAEKLNYVPNIMARGLRTKLSMTGCGYSRPNESHFPRDHSRN